MTDSSQKPRGSGENILLLTDSYKATHWKQYPPETQYIHSYLESRGGERPETVFFGLQPLLLKYLRGQVVTQEKIDEAQEFITAHLGDKTLFNRAGWEHILKDHGGRLPISIRAVPEGLVVPTHNVLMTVENTCHKCFWVTNYVETLLVQVWYTTTVATLSWAIRRMISRVLRDTATDETVDFKLHDFGFRGVSSVESAGLGGLAHLVSFRGSDTMEAAVYAQRYYHEPMASASIPASEHSTITAWGKESERYAYENMLDQYPVGVVACVSDSYNIFQACDHLWGELLRDRVLGRPGTLVVRPDSGPLPDTVIEVLRILGDRFGYTVNAKGFKVLDPHIRVIQGDGVNYDSIHSILAAMKQDGWSAENISFGMGGALLQKLNRDTQNFAFKCSAMMRSNHWVPVYKEPITDPGKNSKRGRLKLVNRGGILTTVQDFEEGTDLLREVFRDGEVLADYYLSEVRARALEGVPVKPPVILNPNELAEQMEQADQALQE